MAEWKWKSITRAEYFDIVAARLYSAIDAIANLSENSCERYVAEADKIACETLAWVDSLPFQNVNDVGVENNVVPRP
jgi:hypothetical protein